MIGSCNCPIRADCSITLSDYNFTDQLEQNTAVYAPITFEEIVIRLVPLSPPPPLLISSAASSACNDLTCQLIDTYTVSLKWRQLSMNVFHQKVRSV